MNYTDTLEFRVEQGKKVVGHTRNAFHAPTPYVAWTMSLQITGYILDYIDDLERKAAAYDALLETQGAV